MSCKARQYSDQMICDKCALQWDVNDPDRPECVSVAKKTIKELKELFEDE